MKQPRFNYSQEFIDSGYKEVHIPAGENGEPQLNIDALHIWPRREFMLMGLANTDNGFTGTVLHRSTENTDWTTQYRCRRHALLREVFQRRHPAHSNLEEQWESNPTSAWRVFVVNLTIGAPTPCS